MDENSEVFLEALRNCESEPIHTPGCIQPDGALLVVSADTTRVLQASANLTQFFGVTAESARDRSLAGLIGEDNARTIRDLPVRGDRQPSVPTFFRFGASQERADMAVQAHRVDGDWVIECESCDETEQESLSQLFHSTRNTLWESDAESDADRYCQLVADLVRRLTGFDRVLAYRFDQQWNGEVIAESRNERLPSLLGHHFPSSDIPAQARRLYTRNLVRALSDIDATPVPLVPATHPVTGKDLDMSYSVLRSMSPIHIEYLRNMGAMASLSISLIQSGRLWGLIACHHSEPRRVPFQVRELAEFIAKSASLKLGSLESAERSNFMGQVQETLIAITRRIGQSGDIVGALEYLDGHILGLLGAGGGVIAIGGRRYPFGNVPSTEDVDSLVRWLQDRCDSEILHTECLGVGYPPAARYKDVAAGLLAVRLDPEFHDYTLWFRPERIRTITWAGNPAKSVVDDAGVIHLEPRRSFDRWVEEQHGSSLPWTTIETESAQALSLTLIEVLSQTALISETRRSEARLKFLANHDHLTRLPNRLLMTEKLEAALARAETSNEDLAVIFVDLDRFKSVNDTLGHLVGDRYLQEVADRLKSSLRHDDVLARWGGDEFVAVIESVRGHEAMDETINRLSARLSEPMQLGEHHLVPSASIGVARFPDDGTDAVGLIQAADAAMYREKEKKRGDPSAVSRNGRGLRGTTIDVGLQLRQALTNSEMVLHYQPQFHISSGKLVGLEALLRWRHPSDGVLPPAEFLPEAETLGLIREVGDRVLRAVCQQIAEWSPDLPPDVAIAINVAPAELDADFVERAMGTIAKEGIPPNRVSLETTEEALERPEAVDALRCLAAAGIELSVDDFGTGYLSLAQLRELPFSCFKIDKHFIDGIPGDEKDEAIVRGVVALASSLGIDTLAEGVETADQLEFLRGAGVGFAQGFHLGRPMPAEEVPHYLRERSALS